MAARLGLTSFGGPVAHLGYFREEYVRRRRWLGEEAYADLVALCQFLPGPASSQVGMAIGIGRAGLAGGIAAWLGFTLPSAIVLVAFALGVRPGSGGDAGMLHGLKVAAVAVVAGAVWGMARALAPDRRRATIAVAAAVLTLLVPGTPAQLGIIAAAALGGWRVLSEQARGPEGPAAGAHSTEPLGASVGRGVAVTALIVFATLLMALPVARALDPAPALAVADSFYRTGSLVFGGGHVVLPLLQAEVVPPGWVTQEQFVAGYGAAQAVPGPLFTFAAYLGALLAPGPSGVGGAALALGAVFLPSFLLVVGILPFWAALGARPDVRAALRGVNAAVVGLLLAALYQPVWTSAVRGAGDVALGLVAFALLHVWAAPPWLVVGLCALVGAVR